MARGRHPHHFARAGGQAVAAAMRAAQERSYWLVRVEGYPAYLNQGLRAYWLTGSMRPLAQPGETVHGPYGSIELACDAASALYGTSAAEQVADHLSA